MVVADALSRKSIGTLATIWLAKWSLVKQLRDLNLSVQISRKKVMVTSLHIQAQLTQKIQELQRNDPRLVKILAEFLCTLKWCTRVSRTVVCARQYGPEEVNLHEVHHTKDIVHLGSTKVYHNLKQSYWWNRMKKEIARYVNKCQTC